jgi:hypothetical protein
MKYLMDKLVKIEELINKYLSFAWEFIIHFIIKLTPKKIFVWHNKFVKKIHHLFSSKVKDSPLKIKKFIHRVVGLLTVIINSIKDIHHVIKALPWKKPHLIILNLFLQLYKKFIELGQKYQLAKWQVSIIFFITVSTFISTPIYISKNTKVIYSYFNPAPIKRAPASIATEHTPKRADYYRLGEHQFEIKNIYIPVYKYNRDGSSFVKMKSLNADFRITLSNRYSREFLSQNSVEFLDRLNASFEPMLKQFPIQDEGRNVLKGKIGFEIDSFLKEKGVEGKADIVVVERLMSF